MTDSPDIQISAFADGELARDESEFLVRRLSRDADARCKTVRYATIGAALRGELIGPDPDVLRRRINASLEGVHVPEHAHASVPNPLRRFLRPAAGVGIAASVAIAALLAVNPDSERGHVAEALHLAVSGAPRDQVDAHMARGGAQAERPHYWNLLAYVYLRRGDLPLAEEVLRDILARHPQDGPAREYLARVLRQQGRVAEADAFERS